MAFSFQFNLILCPTYCTFFPVLKCIKRFLLFCNSIYTDCFVIVMLDYILFVLWIIPYKSYRKKLRVIISSKYPKRTYSNSNDKGEMSTWDLVDTDAISLFAFNLDSYILPTKLVEGRVRQYSSTMFFYLALTVIRIQ